MSNSPIDPSPIAEEQLIVHYLPQPRRQFRYDQTEAAQRALLCSEALFEFEEWMLGEGHLMLESQYSDILHAACEALETARQRIAQDDAEKGVR